MIRVPACGAERALEGLRGEEEGVPHGWRHGTVLMRNCFLYLSLRDVDISEILSVIVDSYLCCVFAGSGAELCLPSLAIWTTGPH